MFICSTIIKVSEGRVIKKISSGAYYCLNELVDEINAVFPGSTLRVDVTEDGKITISGDIKYYRRNENTDTKSGDKIES